MQNLSETGLATLKATLFFRPEAGIMQKFIERGRATKIEVNSPFK